MSMEDEESTDYCYNQPYLNIMDPQTAVNQIDEQKLRKELIKRATTRLRKRLLEQNLQETMSYIISLQAQLESIRVDTAITLDTYRSLFNNDDDNEKDGVLNETDEMSTSSMSTASKESIYKTNRQLDFLEKRLDAHQSSLSQLHQLQQQQPPFETMKESKRMNRHSSVRMEKRDSNISALTALSMSRLSSISLISNFFGDRSSTNPGAYCDSPATSIVSSSSECTNNSISEKILQTRALPLDARRNDTNSSDNVSQKESMHSTEWKPMFSLKQKQQQVDMAEDDHPFYDLAGKRSFGVGSFCGSVYHENDCNSLASSYYYDHDQQSNHLRSEIQQQQPLLQQDRSKRRQGRRRQQMCFEQQYHESSFTFDPVRHTTIIKDDQSSDCSSSVATTSTTPTDSSAGKPSHHLMLNNHVATAAQRLQRTSLCHPLSPPTPKITHTSTMTGYFDDAQHYQHYSKRKTETDMDINTDALQQWLNLPPGIDDSQRDTQKQEPLNEISSASDRNILDEAMSFIAGLSENGDDGGFQDDFYLLLNHPELLGRPFSEIEPAMHEIRKVYYDQQQQQYNKLGLLVTAMSQMPKDLFQSFLHYSSGTLYDVTCHSLQWCRFISVLMAAILISLMKGPDDMRRAPFIVR